MNQHALLLLAAPQAVLIALQRYEHEAGRSRRIVEEMARQEPSLAQEEQWLEQARLQGEHWRMRLAGRQVGISWPAVRAMLC